MAASIVFVNQQLAGSQKPAVKIVRYGISIALLFFVSLNSVAQIIGQFDTTKTAELDTLPHTRPDKKVITIESYAKRYDPRKAILYAAVFPGAGQVYNRKYWKVPLVYGGIAAGYLFIKSYQTQYVDFKNELFVILNDPTLTRSPRGFTQDQLRSVINSARRERDFYIAITGLWYVLQMVDALVDAHLKEFDLNPKLQVRLEPSMNHSPYFGKSTGLALTFRF